MNVVRSGHVSTEALAAKSRPPAVLQVLPELVTGGVERGAVDVAVALAAAGWTSIVVSRGGPLVREIERGGGQHIALPVHSKNPFVIRRNIGALAALIRAHDVDIVHARSRAPAWSAYYAARRAGAHFITTYHGIYNATNALKRAYNSVMTRGERVIAISDYVRERVIAEHGIHSYDVITIHRGIDTAMFDPQAMTAARIGQLARAWYLPDGVPVVMLPGRLTRWKGQTVLIEALSQLKHRKLHCLLVGADQGRSNYRRELETLIRRTGTQEVVRIVGHCNDMPAAFMLADVVVSASTDPEAFGRVAAEAQAMGRPVIATDHGGARETVIAGETGWLVPPRDPAALAQAIEEALSLAPEDRARLAERAITNIRARFTRDRMCYETLDLYTDLLAAQPQAAP